MGIRDRDVWHTICIGSRRRDRGEPNQVKQSKGITGSVMPLRRSPALKRTIPKARRGPTARWERLYLSLHLLTAAVGRHARKIASPFAVRERQFFRGCEKY